MTKKGSKHISLEERERKRVLAREWQLANKDKLKEYNKEFYEKNREQIAERAAKNRVKNKEHQDLLHKKWLEANPDNKRNGDLLRQYGINLNDYNEMLKEQGYLCKLCNGPPSGKGTLHVDHDHNTGVVRGLLCHHCNLGLGHFKDDITLLQKAIDYLLSSKNS